MISITQYLLLLLIGVIAWYAWQSGQFKARALLLARAHCKQLDLQLLDESMVITGLWPLRNRGGGLVFRRTYRFEFTSTGAGRYCGTIILEDMKLKSVHLDTYQLPDVR